MDVTKQAGTPFLDQERPEKVREIYRALKRAHPNMPAEVKARIAAKQGKPGKQKQGPPYKGKLDYEYEDGKWTKTAERLKGGKADHMPDAAFNHEQLRRGTKVEREHTRSRAVAKEVAKDHLTESPNYYKALAKMESRLQKHAVFGGAGPGNPDPAGRERDQARAKKNRATRSPHMRRLYDKMDAAYNRPDEDDRDDPTADSVGIEKNSSSMPREALLLLMEAMLDAPRADKPKRSKKKAKKSESTLLEQTIARATKRLLPGAKLVRSGRPMTDILKKFKKSQRRQLNSEYFKYRGQVVKAPQKSLVTGNRSQAAKAYKHK